MALKSELIFTHATKLLLWGMDPPWGCHQLDNTMVLCTWNMLLYHILICLLPCTPVLAMRYTSLVVIFVFQEYILFILSEYYFRLSSSSLELVAMEVLILLLMEQNFSSTRNLKNFTYPLGLLRFLPRV